MLKLAAIAVILVANPVVFADSGDVMHFNYSPGDPARAAPTEEYGKHITVSGENADIVMSAEEVTITLFPNYAAVDAIFNFKNTASQPVQVEMGFPLDAGALELKGGNSTLWEKLSELQGQNDDAEAYLPLDGSSLKTTLAVAVDDQPAAVEIRNATAVAMYSYHDIVATAVWTLDFAAGGTRRVHCRYRNDYTRHQGTSSVLYTILTGATWRGPIGYGKIVVKPGPGFEHWDGGLFYLTLGMPAPRDDGAAVIWEFRDLEPPANGGTRIPECDYLHMHQEELAGFKAGILVGFTPKDYAHVEGYGYPAEEKGVPAWALVDNLNFREAPAVDAPRIAAKPAFKNGDPFLIVGRRGDWYRVRHIAGGNSGGQGMSRVPGGILEGWVRWRYVDPDNDEENIYVDLIAHGLL